MQIADSHERTIVERSITVKICYVGSESKMLQPNKTQKNGNQITSVQGQKMQRLTPAKDYLGELIQLYMYLIKKQRKNAY